MNPEQTAPITPDAPQDVVEQAPVTEAPVPTEAPAEPVEAVQAPVAPEPAPQPVDEPEANYYEDPIPTFNLPQRPVADPQYAPAPQVAEAPQSTVVPPLNPSDFADQYGNVDMTKFTQAMGQRDQQMQQAIAAQVFKQVTESVLPQAAQIANQQMMTARAEERAWKAAEAKYPELATNKELRDLVHKQRLSVIAGGGNDTPLKSADRLMKFINVARTEGAQEATETTRIQSAAHLESADNTAPAAPDTSKNFDKIGSKNRVEARDARQNLLKQWMADGKLDTTTK